MLFIRRLGHHRGSAEQTCGLDWWDKSSICLLVHCRVPIRAAWLFRMAPGFFGRSFIVHVSGDESPFATKRDFKQGSLNTRFHLAGQRINSLHGFNEAPFPAGSSPETCIKYRQCYKPLLHTYGERRKSYLPELLNILIYIPLFIVKVSFHSSLLLPRNPDLLWSHNTTESLSRCSQTPR